jgi:hypothetical protein
LGTAWVDAVKTRGQLAYATVNEGSCGAYKKAVSDAISEFNSFAKKNKLCVSFVNGGASAEVQIEVTDGPEISYSFGGENYTEEFSGKKMHGRTPQLSRGDKLEKAFVFLPKSPPISTPTGVRLAGSGLLKVIVFHELLHAAGLSNDDHAPDDLFQAQPQYFPGDTPAQDGIMIGSTTKHMPPIILSPKTIRLVKTLWCASGGSLTAEVRYKMRQPSNKSK